MGWKDAITDEEKSFIKENFSTMSIGEIALALGRSYYTIQLHASNMNLHRIHKWTAEEDAMLKELWGNYCAEYISRRMKIEVNSIYNRIRRLKSKGEWIE